MAGPAQLWGIGGGQARRRTATRASAVGGSAGAQYLRARYLAAAATIVPAFAPQIVVADDDLHAFAMTDLGPIPSWRDDLAAGRVDADVGAVLGDHLAAIHAQTAGNDSTAREFASDHLFEALRIEPYLRYSAVRSPRTLPPCRSSRTI